MTWVRDNAATLMGWLSMLVSVAYLTGARVSALEASQEDAQVQVEATMEKVEAQGREISTLSSDVRVLEVQAARQEQVLIRQEQAVREMDRLLISVRTVMEERAK